MHAATSLPRAFRGLLVLNSSVHTFRSHLTTFARLCARVVHLCAVIPFELTELSRTLAQEERELSQGVIDSTGDGVADALLLDTTGDQRPDTIRPLNVAARLAIMCPRCRLASHEPDSSFCRRCGSAIR